VVRCQDGHNHEEVLSKRKKVGGSLRHSIHTLKKVARLPAKDQLAVIHCLKKRVRKRQGSNSVKRAMKVVSQGGSDEALLEAFVDNDRKYWMVLHGSDKVAVEDVWGIEKAIRVKFNGDTHNIFSMLSKGGKDGGV
jgi:hypothetical protein